MLISPFLPPRTPAPSAVTSRVQDEDPWSGYVDDMDLDESGPAPVENEFSAAAARLIQRQTALEAAAKKAREEASAGKKSDKA